MIRVAVVDDQPLMVSAFAALSAGPMGRVAESLSTSTTYGTNLTAFA